MKADEKKCPQCAETIKKDAHLCKYCGHRFSEAEIAAEKQKAAAGQKKGCIGCASVIGVIALITMVGAIAGGDAPPPAEPTSTAKADAITYFRGVMAVMRPCEQSGKEMASAAESGDAIALYRVLDRNEAACLSAPGEVRGVPIPSSVGAVAHEQLKHAAESCSGAVLTRWSTARDMKKLLDQSSVSGLAKLEDSASAIQAQTVACGAGLMSVVMEFGGTSADLGI